MSQNKHDWVCPHCGSHELSFSATVLWSYDKQEWEVVDEGDISGDFCIPCEKEVRAVLTYPPEGVDEEEDELIGDAPLDLGDST